MQFGQIDGPSRLRAKKVANCIGDLARALFRRTVLNRHRFQGLNADAKRAAKLLHEIDVPIGRFVPDGDVATGLIGHVYLVPLFAETDKCAAHADHVIVGVWAKHNHSLREYVWL